MGTRRMRPLSLRIWLGIAVGSAVLAACLVLPSNFARDATAGVTACSDGLDNDADGRVDYNPGAIDDDFGCKSRDDNSESPEPECADMIDNDGDGKIDGFDSSCSKGGNAHPRHDDEARPAACEDEYDDDFDGLTDYPHDPGCASGADNTEEPDDSDADGLNDKNDNCPTTDNAGQLDKDHDGVGNACDGCPRIPAQRPNGCPSVSRSLAIDYSRGAFRGRLSARKAGCEKHQSISVWRKVGAVGGGDDVEASEDLTDQQGRYAALYPKAPGRYYSRAEGDTVPTAGNCKPARSDVIRLK